MPTRRDRLHHRAQPTNQPTSCRVIDVCRLDQRPLGPDSYNHDDGRCLGRSHARRGVCLALCRDHIRDFVLDLDHDLDRSRGRHFYHDGDDGRYRFHPSTLRLDGDDGLDHDLGRGLDLDHGYHNHARGHVDHARGFDFDFDFVCQPIHS